MATELLPIASGAATSADFVADGLTIVWLKPGNSIPYDATVAIEVKDSGGGYTQVAELNRAMISGVPAAGTYRLRRNGTNASVGAEYGA